MNKVIAKIIIGVRCDESHGKNGKVINGKIVLKLKVF